MTKAMPFLQKVILLSYDPRPFQPGMFCEFWRIFRFHAAGGCAILGGIKKISAGGRHVYRIYRRNRGFHVGDPLQ